MKSFILVALVACVALVQESHGHGMMLTPPNRSSAWRYFPGFPTNYDDNSLYCGGPPIELNGPCGLCGDGPSQARPRANENGGRYGTGQKVATYQAGQVIDTYVKLTTNHRGYMTYQLCELASASAMESGEECFKPLQRESGEYELPVEMGQQDFYDRVKLPEGFKCQNCVLRWNYRTGNRWGQCGDGTSALGCGPQETFRTCSDIEIV